MRHKKVGHTFLPVSFPPLGHKPKGQAHNQPALLRNRVLSIALFIAMCWFAPPSVLELLCADVGHVFREGVLLILPEGPGRFEMIVVDEGVHGVVHVSVVRAL